MWAPQTEEVSSRSPTRASVESRWLPDEASAKAWRYTSWRSRQDKRASAARLREPWEQLSPRLSARGAAGSFALTSARMAPNGYLALVLHAHLAVRAASGVRRISGGGLALRGDHRDLPAAARGAPRAGGRRRAFRAHACRSRRRSATCCAIRCCRSATTRYLDRSLALARREVERTQDEGQLARARALLPWTG